MVSQATTASPDSGTVKIASAGEQLNSGWFSPFFAGMVSGLTVPVHGLLVVGLPGFPHGSLISRKYAPMLPISVLLLQCCPSGKEGNTCPCAVISTLLPGSI